MSEENKPKMDLKELRKNEEFMKTIYEQQYIEAGWSLTRVAKHLEEMSGTSITGKSIGNDFKGFGWKLRPSRKAPDYKPVGDIGKLDSIKLKDMDDQWKIFKKIEILFQLKKINASPGISDRFVPHEIIDALEKIAYEGLGLEEIKEHKNELAEKDKQIAKLKKRNVDLESTIINLTNAFDIAKSTQTYLGENPLSKDLK